MNHFVLVLGILMLGVLYDHIIKLEYISFDLQDEETIEVDDDVEVVVEDE